MYINLKISICTKGKLQYINSINSYCLHNTYCKKLYNNKNNICHYCYSIYMLHTFRQNCIPIFKHNDSILSNRILFDKELPILNYGVFRFNSHGELINDIHFINYCKIASNNKYCIFTLFTKRDKLIIKNRKYIPTNLILIYSSSKMNSPSKLPICFKKVYTVYNNNTDNINCIGKCINCLKCYNKRDHTVYINELVKEFTVKGMNTIRHRIKWKI